jgi:hypothetical protein
MPGYTLSQASMPQVIMSQPSMPQASMSQTSEAPPLAPDDDAVKSENIKPENTPSRKKWWLGSRRIDQRVSMTSPEIELAIAEAVKKTAPGCEDFIGVVIRQTTPRSRLDVNWELRGIRFGKADREMANEAVASVVERMQRDFRLNENQPASGH